MRNDTKDIRLIFLANWKEFAMRNSLMPNVHDYYFQMKFEKSNWKISSKEQRRREKKNKYTITFQHLKDLKVF